MALKELAVEGLVFKHNISNAIIQISPSSVPSQKVKGEGKGVYFKQLDIILKSGSSMGSCISNTDFPGIILPTAEKTLVEGEFPLRKGDKVMLSGVPGMSGGSSCSFNCEIEIDDPGQSSNKGA